MENKCESCGMPVSSGQYCQYCTDSKGKLKSRTDVRNGWVNFVMNSEKITRQEAEKKVDDAMSKLPAWKK